jgi:chaperone modulatory protein CbpM
MNEIERVCRLVGNLEAVELERWIGERWVLPSREGEEGAYVFQEVDIARVQLIAGLKRELAIDEEAMPVVLNLLDQLYDLRRRIKAVRAALDTLPEDMRAAIARHLEGE